MIYNNKRNQCQKKKGKRTFRDHWQSTLDYNGVGISGAGLRLVDSWDTQPGADPHRFPPVYENRSEFS